MSFASDIARVSQPVLGMRESEYWDGKEGGLLLDFIPSLTRASINALCLAAAVSQQD